jgi:hypothetical protein
VLLTPIALLRRATRAVALAFVIGALMVLRPGYLPAMYVIALLPFAALIVAGTADGLWRAQRRSPFPRVGAVLTATAIVALLAVVAPRWQQGDTVAMTARPDSLDREAESWIASNIGHDKRIIVHDLQWIYLIDHGFDATPVKGGFYSRTVVSYWPLDYDPAVKREFPHGWRDFDYIVSTQAMRGDLTRTPITAAAIAHSVVMVRFGEGARAIEIRAIVDKQAPG